MTRTPTSWIALAALWPKIYVLRCCYCGGKATRGGYEEEGAYCHKACHQEQCR